MKRLAILGASGHGKVIADAALASGWSVIVFYDDAWPRLTRNGRWPIEGDSATLIEHSYKFDGVIVGIGNNRIRLNKLFQLSEAGAPLVSIIHPQATISRFAELGAGCVMFAGSVINVDSSLGQGCIVNTGATIDHDCSLAAAVHISPGAHLAGGVRIGECSWIGIGAAIKQYVTIEEDVIVGAGAAVIDDIAALQTWTGVPARALVRNE